MRTDTRGVSDTVGFVLVFGLITAVIATAFTGGMAGLESAQQAEQNANVERAFDVLHDNLRDIHQDGAPSRATEIQLLGTTLKMEDQTEITVYVENASNSSDNETIVPSRSSTALTYVGPDNTRIIYDSGAIIRSQDGNAVMVRPPDIVVNDTAVVPVVRTRSVGQSTITRKATVLIIGEHGSDDLGEFSRDGNVTVNLTVQSPYADAWEDYFTNHGSLKDAEVTFNEDMGQVSVEFKAKEVYVPETRIDVRLRG